MSQNVSRRAMLGGVAGASLLSVAGATALATGAQAATAPAVPISTPRIADIDKVEVVNQGTAVPRLWWFELKTAHINFNPRVNILFPEGYNPNGGKRYPVLYMLHGGQGPQFPGVPSGGQDFRFWHQGGHMVPATAGRDIIVVMPDGGNTGWYSNPVDPWINKPRNWEFFHMNSLIPWVDATFRTIPEFSARAVGGFSMGGFGALKYAAKYYGHFSSVTSFSGPASLRREFGAVLQWAQISAAADIGNPAGLYGLPAREDLVTADNAVENLERYRGKRLVFFSGTDANDVQEGFVHRGHQEFSAALNQRGIQHWFHSFPGGHGGNIFSGPSAVVAEVGSIVSSLRRAG